MTDLPVIHAADLTPSARLDLHRLLRKDKLSDPGCVVAVNVRWVTGQEASTRVTAQTFREIVELVK